MANRHAFLFGVSDYKDVDASDLPATQEDTRFLEEALCRAGYKVVVPSDANRGRVTGRELKRGVTDAIRTPNAQTVIVVYSGHGLTYKGRDFLVPSDARPLSSIRDAVDARDFEESLVHLDFYQAIASATAKTIVFLIDACREGFHDLADQGTEKAMISSWGQEQIVTQGGKQFAIVLACQPGEYAHTSKNGEYSLFSKSIAEVISSDDRPTNLQDLRDRADKRLSEYFKIERQEEPKDRIRIRGESSTGYQKWILFDGATAPASVGNPFLKALDESLFGRNLADNESSPLREAAQKIAGAAWNEFEAARTAVPQDVWSDEQFPKRVLEQAFRWCAHCGLLDEGANRLTSEETALLATAPFVYELMLARAKKGVASEHPCTIDGGTTQSQPALGRLQQWYLTRMPLVRQATRAREQGKTHESEAIAAWLMHAYLRRDPELFWKLGATAAAPEPLLDSTRPHIRDIFESRRLVELARSVRGNPDSIARSDRPHALRAEVEVFGAGKVREQLLGMILCLAGWTALDPRQVPQIAVEHVCVADPLRPEDILAAVRACSWTNRGTSRSLVALCKHPALDAAFNDYVNAADAVLQSVLITGVLALQTLSKPLPARLTSADVVPEKHGGIPAYEANPLKFELAQDEIRELLMGENLYGDPSLAIRELYQNALDACRYRDMRTRYLRLKGAGGAKLEGYVGEIRFRQGEEKGRTYIECEDNGIGMSRVELRACFAKAGRRFHDQPEFIEEQADWVALDPELRLYPNSQFGIGVLSYFMLAEEVEVETCRLDRQGKPGENLFFRIPGSGSLFRIESRGNGSRAGTRVRLYLNSPGSASKRGIFEKRVSCVGILKDLLWIAEYPTSAIDGDDKAEWPPKTLPDWRREGLGDTGDPRMWWSDDGKVLADGLKIPRGHGPAGMLVNFIGAHRARLTVSRTDLVEYDKAWVGEMFAKVYTTAVDWSRLSLEWLLKVDADWTIRETLARAVGSRHERILVNRSSPQQVDVRQCGVFPPDSYFIEGTFDLFGGLLEGGYRFPTHLLKGRLEYWLTVGVVKRWPDWLEPSEGKACDPLCLWPSDAVLLSRDMDGKFLWLEASATAAEVYARALKLGWSPKRVVDRLQVLGIEAPTSSVWNRSAAELAILLDGGQGIVSIGNLLAKAVLMQKSPHAVAGWLEEIGIRCARANLPTSDLNDADLPLLSEKGDGRAPWIGDRVGLGHVRFLSVRTQRSPADVSARLTQLGIQAPTVGSDIPAPSEADLVLLSGRVNSAAPWIESESSRAHLLVAAFRNNRPVAEVVARFRTLGIETHAARDDPAALTSEEEVARLSYDLDGTAPWVAQTLSVGHVLAASAHARCTPLDMAKRFRELGFGAPPFIESEEPTSAEDLVVASTGFNAKRPWCSDIAPLGHVLAASAKTRRVPYAVAARMNVLGIACPRVTPDTRIPDEVDVKLLSRDLDGRAPWNDTCSLGQILAAALQTGLAAREVVSRLRSLGVDCADVPDGCASLALDDVELLSTTDNPRRLWLKDRVAVGDVIEAALRTSRPPADVAERLRALGLTVDGSFQGIAEASREDLKLLSQGLSGQAPWILGPVSKGHLLAAWARLDLDPSNSGKILDKYGVGYPTVVAVCKPSTEDLEWLSEDFSGEPPWCEGEVSWARILAGSVLTQCTPQAAAARLVKLGIPCAESPPTYETPAEADLDLICLFEFNRLKGGGSTGFVRLLSLDRGEAAATIAARLTKLGLRVELPARPTSLRMIDLTEVDFFLVSRNLDGSPPFLDDEAPPGFLDRAEAQLGFPREKLRRRLSELGIAASDG